MPSRRDRRYEKTSGRRAQWVLQRRSTRDAVSPHEWQLDAEHGVRARSRSQRRPSRRAHPRCVARSVAGARPGTLVVGTHRPAFSARRR